MAPNHSWRKSALLCLVVCSNPHHLQLFSNLGNNTKPHFVWSCNTLQTQVFIKKIVQALRLPASDSTVTQAHFFSTRRFFFHHETPNKSHEQFLWSKEISARVWGLFTPSLHASHCSFHWMFALLYSWLLRKSEQILHCTVIPWEQMCCFYQWKRNSWDMKTLYTAVSNAGIC